MRVWISGKTTAFQAVVGGSIPLTRTYRHIEKTPLGRFFYNEIKLVLIFGQVILLS